MEPEEAASGRPGRSAPSKNQIKRSASVRSVHPGPKGKTAGAKKSPDQTPGDQTPSRSDQTPGDQTPNRSELEALSESQKQAIQKRAEGRTKVPPRFRDSVKRFFYSPTGTLKVARLILLIAALTIFIIAEASESFIAITVLEIFIVILFILIYMLTLHHLLTYIHWPLLDLINSFITTVFLLIVAILTMQEKARRNLFYVGGSLCLAAAIVCLVDASLVTKMVRKSMKKVLGLEGETESKSATGEEPAQQPGPEASRMPSPAASESAAVGAVGSSPEKD